MGKQTKWMLKYRDGNLPADLDQVLSNADEGELKLLIALLLSADSEGQTEASDALAHAVGMEREEMDAALQFWRGAGLLGRPSGKKSVAKAEKETTSKVGTAHRNGALERAGGTVPYETAELATLLEQRAVTAQFVDEAQKVAGKTFNTYDTGILVGLVHQFGFEEEAVLAILAYVRLLGKKGIRYVEKVALSFYDEGLTGYAEVQERINRMERSGETLGKIKHLFGFGERELSATEKKLFLSWVEKFGYDMDVIRFAYEITVDTIQQPAPKYTNGILEKWYVKKLRTIEEIRAFEEAKRAEKQGKSDKLEKSYDLDDFFEAALRRSYDETPT